MGGSVLVLSALCAVAVAASSAAAHAPAPRAASSLEPLRIFATASRSTAPRGGHESLAERLSGSGPAGSADQAATADSVSSTNVALGLRGGGVDGMGAAQAGTMAVSAYAALLALAPGVVGAAYGLDVTPQLEWMLESAGWVIVGTAAVLYCLTHGMLADCAAVGYGFAPLALSSVKTLLNGQSRRFTSVPIVIVGALTVASYWLFSSRTAVHHPIHPSDYALKGATLLVGLSGALFSLLPGLGATLVGMLNESDADVKKVLRSVGLALVAFGTVTSALAFGIDPMDGHAADMAALAGIPLILSCANLAIGPKTPHQALPKRGRVPKVKVYDVVAKKSPRPGAGIGVGAGAAVGVGAEKLLGAFKGFDPGGLMAAVAWVILSTLTPNSASTSRSSSRSSSRAETQSTETPFFPTELPKIPSYSPPRINMPDLPKFPSPPQISMPDLPKIPSAPQLNMPDLSKIPSPSQFIMPDLPKIPSPPQITMPDLPNLPKVDLPPLPNLPSINIQNMPDMPSLDLPDMPNMPNMPNMPSMPKIDVPAIELKMKFDVPAVDKKQAGAWASFTTGLGVGVFVVRQLVAKFVSGGML